MTFLRGAWTWFLAFLVLAPLPLIIIAGLLLPLVLPGVLVVGVLLYPYAVWRRYIKEAR